MPHPVIFVDDLWMQHLGEQIQNIEGAIDNHLKMLVKNDIMTTMAIRGLITTMAIRGIIIDFMYIRNWS